MRVVVDPDGMDVGRRDLARLRERREAGRVVEAQYLASPRHQLAGEGRVGDGHPAAIARVRVVMDDDGPGPVQAAARVASRPRPAEMARAHARQPPFSTPQLSGTPEFDHAEDDAGEQGGAIPTRRYPATNAR